MYVKTVLCDMLEGRGREYTEEGALILQLEGKEEGH